MSDSLIPYFVLVPYASIVLGLTLTLVLFCSVKIEMRRSARRERRRVDDLLERLQHDSAAQGPPEPVFVPVAGRPGLNIHRRVHVMRLLRKGETPSHIAATLGIPQKEVELLIRVQEIVNSKAHAAGSD